MSSKTWNMPADVHTWLVDHVLHEPEPLTRLRERTFAEVDAAQMQISPEQGRFMAWLVRTLGVTRAVEVGTFTGYSALCMAQAMPSDGQLVCCDISREWTAIAEAFWERAGVRDRIDLRIAPALETLDAMLAAGDAGGIDMAFVDADKTHYADYYERGLQLLRPGGLLLFDNTLWSGSVADPTDREPDTVALRELNRRLHADARVSLSLVPIGDGLTLARKR